MIISGNNIEMMREVLCLSLSTKLKLDLFDAYGLTPLMFAAYKAYCGGSLNGKPFDFTAILEALVAADADPNIINAKTKKAAYDYAGEDTPHIKVAIDTRVAKFKKRQQEKAMLEQKALKSNIAAEAHGPTPPGGPNEHTNPLKNQHIASDEGSEKA